MTMLKRNWNEDGKGPSNWDWRARNTDKIKGGATGDVALDWRADAPISARVRTGNLENP